MTAFRRLTRYRQALWREARGFPMGSQPIAPRPGQRTRPVGSRLPLDYARQTGANFLGAGAREAASARSAYVEPNQSIDHQRLWADLLWSPALAFNLFGELAADLALADRALHSWWPDAPGAVREVRFSHSPGWLDPAYLNSLRRFDAVFVLDLGGGDQGVLAVDVKYHEPLKPETPRPENLARYQEVAERSEAFTPRALELVRGRNDLAVMWLEHLLLHSMLQHPDARWRWGRYVVARAAGNVDYAEACARYQKLLEDRSTFATVTLEELLGAGVLPAEIASAIEERYVPPSTFT